MNKTVKRILVIGAVIAGVICFVFFGFVYCPACGPEWPFWPELEATIQATCSPCTDAWKDDLPAGKLVLVIPKTIILSEQYMAFALAYSPENETANKIVDEYLQDFLYRLNLSEARVNIIETDIVMEPKGYPYLFKVNTPPRSLERKSKYNERHSVTIRNCLENKSRYFGPEGITIWEMEFIPQEDWPSGQNEFWFSYSNVEGYSCSQVCGYFPELLNFEYEEVKIFLKRQTLE